MPSSALTRATAWSPCTARANILAGTNPANVLAACLQVLAGNGKAGRRPKLWDGKAAERIVCVLAEKLGA